VKISVCKNFPIHIHSENKKVFVDKLTPRNIKSGNSLLWTICFVKDDSLIQQSFCFC